MPSVTGTGVVKVVNGVFQSPASTIVNSDVSASAAIDVSKLAMSTNRLLGRTTAGTGAVEQITVGTGLSLSAGTLSSTVTAGVTNVTATAPLTSSGGTTPDISTSIATNKVVGRSTAGTGVMEELTPVGITVSAGNITGIGGTVGTVDNAVPRADGTGGFIVQGSDIVIDDATTSTQNNVAITNQHAGQTNSALVLTPKGTGALIAGPKPDGTATGGNARGNNAVCLQPGGRSAATQVASGAQSVAIGYRATASTTGCVAINGTASGLASVAIANGVTASGTYSVAIAGENASASGTRSVLVCGYYSQASADSATGIASVFSTSSADYSVHYGRNALANRYGMHAHCNGSFAGGSTATGDAQRARFVLRNSTANNTPTELFLDGSSTRLTIPVNKSMGFTIQVIGSIQGMAENAYFVRKGIIVNDNATTTLVGSVESVGTDQKSAGATATDVTVTASDANDALIITVTGIAAQNWRWVASVDAVEVLYA